MKYSPLLLRSLAHACPRDAKSALLARVTGNPEVVLTWKPMAEKSIYEIGS